MSHLFSVGISTVCLCMQEFCNVVIKLLHPVHIITPNARKCFEKKWRALQNIGAIDKSHIPILVPKEFPQDNFNRKGWHSIILQGAVDGKGSLDMYMGFPGNVHDPHVLTQFLLSEVVSEGQFLITILGTLHIH